jgi:RNA polymerase sigma-70 factor, ECF subfamily
MPGVFFPAVRPLSHVARPLSAWLLAITRNLALNHVRHVRRAPGRETLARLWEPEHPTDPLERRESLELCVRLVRALPAELREPFVLRTLFDLDVKGVAQVLDLSVATARGRLFRARKALAEALRGARS